MGKRLAPKDIFVADELGSADLGIVIGAADEADLSHRMVEAVRLHRAGKLPLLLLCGDGRDRHSSGVSEAERMRLYCEQQGVPASAVLCEDSSSELTRLGKAVNRRFASESVFSGVATIALISSAWHVLRAGIVMKKHLPKRVRICRHPAADGVTAANWSLSDRGRAIADNELRLIDKLLSSGYSVK